MFRMIRLPMALGLALAMPGLACQAVDDGKIRTLIVDGQNNHDWKTTTPILKSILENTGKFQVEVATSPGQGGDMSRFRPEFSKFDVVVSNYNGEAWPEATRNHLVEFVKGGGGLVIVHAANNAFTDWPEYNAMIGLGGWGGRDESHGPYVRFQEGEIVRDTSPGRGGSHGRRHEFVVVAREPDHPILEGLPAEWKHAEDELYDRLRGPAENLTVLATAYADPSTGGSGEHEPMLMTIDYGDGRVFHTTLGHDATAMRGIGFQVTLIRGTEWAANGEVTLTEVPDDFPSAEQSRSRDQD